MPDPRTAYGNGGTPGPIAGATPPPPRESAFGDGWELEPEPEFDAYFDDEPRSRDRAGEAE